MPLDLEIAGAVRDLTEGEEAKRPELSLKRLRDSHHAVAKLLARGLTEAQVSLQTGYSLSRISVLKHDPAFQELLAHYQRDVDMVAAEIESRFLAIAGDFAQDLHEDLLDGSEIPFPLKLEAFKVFADRAGYAPLQRSVNKNVNLNIGDRLDAARRRREPQES